MSSAQGCVGRGVRERERCGRGVGGQGRGVGREHGRDVNERYEWRRESGMDGMRREEKRREEMGRRAARAREEARRRCAAICARWDISSGSGAAPPRALQENARAQLTILGSLEIHIEYESLVLRRHVIRRVRELQPAKQQQDLRRAHSVLCAPRLACLCDEGRREQPNDAGQW